MGFLRTYGLALVLTLTILPAVAAAQTAGEWTSKGPFCARPFGLATAKGITAPAYMAVGGSLFRSLDAWATWSRVGAGLPASYLSDVAEGVIVGLGVTGYRLALQAAADRLKA